ncbi:PLP-dependent transferase [Myroides marinus]|uniref:trans-sulfuration enzyme family protein n=1 Tax=Myroides marinus TaxID=703342 RepID=UPI002578FAE9|nr:PLP-dependent aspartate aminotransferase family protein [Myroides marinus]MDM1368551.1 PLP-dependent transferase [Myroides marinus]MDM1372491.1 PLP-dependent transferase [Myroides marinus]MDM1375374.1 PLP-dependent transferase [Myroides marinus]MDM1382707.1 PLP-dependent transferase [Myroides marinus]MDM1389503.1 PLP-dependent transferase [Myroides marinus]
MSTQTDILKHIPIDPHTGAIAVPIYQTTTFAQEAPGVNKGFDYTRTNNPTRQALEELVASLENGAKGFAFGSGLAAIDAVFKTLSQGDEVIAVANIYGGTYRLLNEVYAKFGIKTHYVDTTIVENVEKAITNNTKLIWIESPTNPTLRISDIQVIADIAKKHKVWLCVDNTFATPIAQKPLDLGADLVVHSATKYIAGHSDVVAGLVITKTEELGKIIKFHQNSTGAILSPFDSFLTIRGIETLLLRYKGYSENALKIAEYLSTHPKINKIYYPGLVNHEGYELAKKQQKYFGGVISFDLKDNSKEAALKIIKSLKLFTLTEGLGGIKSLSNYPFEMSHGSVPKETKIEAGITESLIRLSIGLEETEDLIEDIKQALAQ